MSARVVITVPADARVLLLEDTPERVAWFRARLPEVRVVNTSAQAADLIGRFDWDLVVLDHDLEETTWDAATGTFDTGLPVARSLAAHGYAGERVVIHSWNPSGAANMAACFDNRAVVIPFGQFEIRLAADHEKGGDG